MLTDTACKNAHKRDKAKLGKAFKLSDDKGLYSDTVREQQLAGGIDPIEHKKAVKVSKNCFGRKQF
jgi:hypothetical protein